MNVGHWNFDYVYVCVDAMIMLAHMAEKADLKRLSLIPAVKILHRLYFLYSFNIFRPLAAETIKINKLCNERVKI